MIANFELFKQERIERIELFLNTLLPLDTATSPLFEAMRCAVLNGGKRTRPLLVYAAGEALGLSPDLLDAPAAAVELIHCYSLIHDDLPAMDNDDLRRGKPTSHKVFGEAVAILAGDALLTLAFQILSDPSINPLTAEQQIHMINILSKKSGMNGMVGGQTLDIVSEKKQTEISLEDLNEIHQQKTGALIEASVMLGGISAKADLKILSKLQEYAKCIGLAFQIQDDILDSVSDTGTLGKTSGKDLAQNKATFPRLLGIDKSKEYANNLHQQALESIGFLDKKNHYLGSLSELLINRKN